MSIKLDLAIKEFDPTKQGTFIGYTKKREIFMQLYIEKLYGNELHYIRFTYINIIFTKEYDDYKNITDPILWNKNKNDLYFLNDVPHEYIKKYQKTNKRFTLYPIHLYARYKEGGHILYILYDKIHNKIEFFDNTTHINDILKYKYEIIINFFKEIYGDNLVFDFINHGYILSQYELEYCNTEKYIYKSDGYCIVWVLWFLELRLKNSKLNAMNIIYKIKDILIKKPEVLCEILIGYAQFVDKLTNDYKYVIIHDKINRISLKSDVKLKKRKRMNSVVASLIVLLSSIYMFRKNLYKKYNK